MSAEVVTIEDLKVFRAQLLSDLAAIIEQFKTDASPVRLVEGLRTEQACKLLDCSNGKLLSLRSAGKIRCRKVGGTLYYNQEDIRKVMKNGTSA